MSDTTVTTEFRADAGDVLRSQEKVIQGYQKVNAELRLQLRQAEAAKKAHQKIKEPVDRNEQALKKAGRAHHDAFGGRALRDLGSYAHSMFGVAAAIGLATRMFQEAMRARQEALQHIKDSRLGLSSLSQLAESPAEMERLVKMAKLAYGMGGGQDLDAAARLVFSVVSAGEEKDLGLYAQLRGKGLVEDPATMARAVATMKTAMGTGETGDTRAILSKIFGASKFSPASAEQLLESASTGATFARQLGISDEELMAAVAIESKEAGSAEQGATRVRQMLKSLAEVADAQGFQGKSLADILTDIDARGLGVEGLKGILGGRAEAMMGYSGLVANLDEYRRALAEVRAAQADQRVDMKLGLSGSVPELKAAEIAERAEASRKLGMTGLGTDRAYAEAAWSYFQETQREAGRPEWVIALNNVFHSIDDFVTGDKFQIRSAFEAYHQETGRWDLFPNAAENQEAYERAFGEPLPLDEGAAKQRDRTNELLEELVNNTKPAPGAKPMSRPGKDK